MDLYDDPTTVQQAPAVPAAGPNGPGYFTDGVPGQQAPTNIRGWWLNGIGLEIRNAIVGAGLVPARALFTQLFTAIQTLAESAVNNAPHATVALSNSGNWPVPANVYSIRVARWGGGGGGGGAQAGTTGVGGGGGAYAEDVLIVEPGQEIPYSVGAFGVAGTPTASGGTGASTTFGTLAAVNGGIGGNSSGSANGQGGQAAAAAFSLPGGDGAQGSGSMGGAGGDSPLGGQGGVPSPGVGRFGSGQGTGAGVGAGGGGAGSADGNPHNGAPGNAGGIVIRY